MQTATEKKVEAEMQERGEMERKMEQEQKDTQAQLQRIDEKLNDLSNAQDELGQIVDRMDSEHKTHVQSTMKSVEDSQWQQAKLDVIVKRLVSNSSENKQEDTDLNQLVGKLEKEKEVDDIKRAQVQKKISKQFNLESVDN